MTLEEFLKDLGENPILEDDRDDDRDTEALYQAYGVVPPKPEKMETILEDLNNAWQYKHYSYVGTAHGKDRPRKGSVVTKDGSTIKTTFITTKTKDFQQGVLQQVKQDLTEDHVPIQGEVRVRVTVQRAIPKTMVTRNKLVPALVHRVLRPYTKPDVDNYDKAILDALNKVLWTDDAIISTCESNKVWGTYDRIDLYVKYRQLSSDRIMLMINK